MSTKRPTPPVSNTGAENTTRSGLRALIDWLQATFKNISLEDLINGILDLNMDDFSEMDVGGYGYRKSLRLGNITILYDGNDGMGIHLQMSGKGCREYEGYGKRKWSQLLAMILDLQSNITRLDLAIDDFTGYFQIPEIEKKIKRGEIQSKFKEATNYEKIRLKDGYTKGQTLYLGSSTSLLKIRFYDKYKEHIEKDKKDDLEGIEFWNRTELQLKDGRAMKVAWLIANETDIGEIATGVLNHYVRFTVQGNDTNKSRWKTWKKWEHFIGDAAKIKLTELPKERTLEMRISWIDRQVTPTLATILKAESEDFLLELVRDAKGRLKDKDLMMIDQYKESKQVRQELENRVMDMEIEENRMRDQEMWKRRRKVARKLLGIEQDTSSAI